MPAGLRKNRIILFPGFGLMKTPGHPSANQSLERQGEFLEKYKKQGYLPIFYTNPLGGGVLYLGDYKLKGLLKKVSFEGFQYYEYTFYRITKNKYY